MPAFDKFGQCLAESNLLFVRELQLRTGQQVALAQVLFDELDHNIRGLDSTDRSGLGKHQFGNRAGPCFLVERYMLANVLARNRATQRSR